MLPQQFAIIAIYSLQFTETPQAIRVKNNQGMFLPRISYPVWFAVQLCKQLHLAGELI